MSYFMS